MAGRLVCLHLPLHEQANLGTEASACWLGSRPVHACGSRRINGGTAPSGRTNEALRDNADRGALCHREPLTPCMTVTCLLPAAGSALSLLLAAAGPLSGPSIGSTSHVGVLSQYHGASSSLLLTPRAARSHWLTGVPVFFLFFLQSRLHA
jgi:hypothetical protein